ncbi:MAG: hypothetical protein HQM10_00990 [Candidatus Riflebacteria bacterium]|nr:hypothetical protein [Candidatus Riflebacteria bacterium]
MIVHIFGDSLSLPRLSDGIPFHLTYPELFKGELSMKYPNLNLHLFNWSHGGANITSTLDEFLLRNDYFSQDAKNIFILQIGIVDCAPRPLPKLLRGFVGVLPDVLQKPIVRFIHNNRARIQKAGFVYHKTPPALFETVLNELMERIKKLDRIYVFNIAPTNKKTEKHSPGFTRSVMQYNEIIKSVIQRHSSPNIFLIDVFNNINNPSRISQYINKEDGHHITVEGHELYTKLLLENEKLFPIDSIF